MRNVNVQVSDMMREMMSDLGPAEFWVSVARRAWEQQVTRRASLSPGIVLDIWDARPTPETHASGARYLAMRRDVARRNRVSEHIVKSIWARKGFAAVVARYRMEDVE